MGIDSVRCTSHQRYHVLFRLNIEIFNLLRQDNSDLFDLIGQNLIQNRNRERIPHDQLVDIGEQLRRG